jgi:ParB family chromosome partitioning protein
VARRSGLGKGLGALIPPIQGAVVGSMLREVPLTRIRPNPYQPRHQFGEQGLSALVDSIKAVGILQPVLVREVGPDQYELIAGERRFRAARRAGLQSIPALVHRADDATSLEEALVENLHREDLNPLDEAGAYQQLIEEFSLTHEEVARKVGRSRAAVTNALRLFQLPPTVQRYVRDSQLSAGHARSLLGTPDRILQERLASESIRRGLSVRALEELVRTAIREAQATDEDGLESIDEDGRRAAEPSSVPTVNKRAHSLRPPGVHDLEELLEDRLNTRVKVDMGGKRGKLVIEFATLDDLERIYRVIIGEAST